MYFIYFSPIRKQKSLLVIGVYKCYCTIDLCITTIAILMLERNIKSKHINLFQLYV